MTKVELIKYLQDSELSDSATVILSRDTEGNSFEELFQAEEMVYYEDAIYYRRLTDELKRGGFTEEDICEYDGEDVIVLWP